MPFIRTGRSQIYYEVHGSGPTLVFAHGVGGNHASWFNQISDLSDDFQIVVFDHRGFGRSTDVEDVGRDAFADDLEKIVETLSLQDFVLVAQSMGGSTSLEFAVRHPSRLCGLVLADTMVGFAVPEECKRVVPKLPTQLSELTQAERVLGKTYRRQNPRMTQLYLELASFNSVTLKTLKGDQRTVSLKALIETKLPVLYVVGEEDVLFPPPLVRAVQALVPGSSYAEIPQAGHSAYFEKPDAFNEILRNWIAMLAG